jgi:hypothetical protein
MKDEEWLSFWYTALAARNGVVLSVTDTTNAKAKLYQVRKLSGDPDLMALQIRTSPDNPDSELWLVKGPQSGQKSSGTAG